MGLVDDHQIPLTHPHLLDQLVATGQMIEPSDQQIMKGERVTETGRVDRLGGSTNRTRDRTSRTVRPATRLPGATTKQRVPDTATLGHKREPLRIAVERPRGRVIKQAQPGRVGRLHKLLGKTAVDGSVHHVLSRCDRRHRTSANRFRRWAVVGIRTGTNARPTDRKAVP